MVHGAHICAHSHKPDHAVCTCHIFLGNILLATRLSKAQKASIAKVWWSLGPKTAKVAGSLKVDKATGDVYYELKLSSKLAWGPGVSTALCVNLPGRGCCLRAAHAPHAYGAHTHDALGMCVCVHA